MKTIKDLKFDKNNYSQISGFGGYYYISRDGNVLSTRQNQPRILKQYTNNSGYRVVFIMYKQRQSVLLVHRLIALAYVENPQNKNIVNHKDDNKLNNHPSNLEWTTCLENAIHARQMGLTVGVPHRQETKDKLRLINTQWAKTHPSPTNKKVVDIVTGIVYESAKKAAAAHSYCYTHFLEMINNKVKNKTNCKYHEH